MCLYMHSVAKMYANCLWYYCCCRIGDFYRKYGLKGFVSQGVIPEVAKSSVMRVSKFFFFPIACEAMWNKKPGKASAIEKGLAGA